MINNANDVEDEWENIDDSLKSLDLTESDKKKPVILKKPPLSLASKFIVAGSAKERDIISVSDPPPQQETEVDPALLGALADPKERMFLLQTEQKMADFIESQNQHLEFLPGVNSFKKLLTYRLGDRFRLNHAPSEQYAENGDRGVVFSKTAQSNRPKTLLIDMNVQVSDMENAMLAPQQQAITISPSSVPSSIAGGSTGSKKVMVMRRRTDKNRKGTTVLSDRKSAEQADRNKQSTEERNKAYLEARARIFGDENPSEADSGLTISDAEISSKTDGSISPRLEEQRKCQNVSSPSDKNNVNISEANVENMLVGADSGTGLKNSEPQQQQLSRNVHQNKSRARNIHAERNDPDFVRRSGPMGNGSVNLMQMESDRYMMYHGNSIANANSAQSFNAYDNQYNNVPYYGYGNNPGILDQNHQQMVFMQQQAYYSEQQRLQQQQHWLLMQQQQSTMPPVPLTDSDFCTHPENGSLEVSNESNRFHTLQQVDSTSHSSSRIARPSAEQFRNESVNTNRNHRNAKVPYGKSSLDDNGVLVERIAPGSEG